MNLFTYGTLMDAAVWERVAQEPCRTRRATLDGYEARELRGVTYPGLVEAPGVQTEGLLYVGVSEAAMERLDAYEDDCYTRVPLSVVLDDGSMAEAEVYLITPEHRASILPGRWQPP